MPLRIRADIISTHRYKPRALNPFAGAVFSLGKVTEIVRLDDASIKYLRTGGEEAAYSKGEVLVRRNEPARAFFVVLSGDVEILLATEDGGRMPLARLGEGESFGEMSILTKEPVSADVVAVGEVRVLEYPAAKFHDALAESTSLRNHILARLCDNLRETSTKAWGFFQRAEALRALLRIEGKTGEIVAESPAMQKARDRINELAKTMGPVLVHGESGTGRLFAARKIHEAGPAKAQPLVVADCIRLDREEAARFLFGSAGDRKFDKKKPGRHSLAAFGALDLADKGTLVIRHIDTLDAESQKILSHYLDAVVAHGGEISPQVRIIATTREDLGALSAENGFDPGLAAKLRRESIEMPQLKNRKRDILPLAELFLSERDRQFADHEHFFSKSAVHALLSARYRHRNAAELREAVESAALFAVGEEIGSEHVFTGPKADTALLEYNLSSSAFIRVLMNKRVLWTLQAGTFIFLMGVAAICLTAGDTLAGRIANGLIWGVWWPLLIIMSPTIGRLWCTVCPVSAGGRVLRRIKSLFMPPSQWIKGYGPWLAVALFVVIIWSEHVFDMPGKPFGTAFLLFGLVLAAGISGFFYERETWCRYLCPLGGLAASYSVPAAVRVHADPGVCSSQCKTHECFKGSENEAGCPVFHHPVYAKDGHMCKLCFTCLKSCPHGSVKPYFRLPLQGVWGQNDLGGTLVPFALVVFMLTVVMLASRVPHWHVTAVPFTGMVLAAVVAGAAFHFVLPWLLSKERPPDIEAASRVAFGMLVLSWGPLLAFHLENIPGISSLVLRARPGSIWRYVHMEEVSLLTLLQLSSIALAAVLAGFTLLKVYKRMKTGDGELTILGWYLLVVICATYTAAAVAIALAQGGYL